MTDIQQRQSASVLYDLVKRTTMSNKIKWLQGNSGWFSATFPGGGVTISSPMHDLRGGDFCWFYIHGTGGARVAEISVGTELWNLIHTQPVSGVIADLIVEIGRL